MNPIFYIFKCLNNACPLISEYFLYFGNLTFFLLNQRYLFALKIPYGKPSFLSFLIHYYRTIVKFTTKPAIAYSTYGKNFSILKLLRKTNMINF